MTTSIAFLAFTQRHQFSIGNRQRCGLRASPGLPTLLPRALRKRLGLGPAYTHQGL